MSRCLADIASETGGDRWQELVLAAAQAIDPAATPDEIAVKMKGAETTTRTGSLFETLSAVVSMKNGEQFG